MKFGLMLIILGFSLGIQAQKTFTKDDVDRIYNDTLGGRMVWNRITERLPLYKYNEWNQFLKDFKVYLQNDCCKKTNEIYSTIVNASNDLLNTLKIAFNSQIAPALKNQADKTFGIKTLDPTRIDKSKIDIKELDKILQPLRKIKEKLAKSINDLIHVQEKPQTLMDTLAAELEADIDHALVNLEEIKKFAAAQKG